MMKQPARSFVDMQSGEISREIFVDETIYRQEQERIFARAWVYVGHETQTPSAGDFFLSRMGEESVIVTRDGSNRVRVLLNTCRHRGMRVCRYDEGNTNAFQCPYHGWTYGVDGKLLGVQRYDRIYEPPFDKDRWGLIEAAKIANFRGTIWATWDADAPPFEEYLGEARFALDIGFCSWDAGEGGTEVLGSVQKWIIPANWKIVAENFAGDVLHNISHRSVDLVGLGPNDKAGRRDDPGRGALAACPEGHGIIYTVAAASPERADYSASPATAAYFKRCWEMRLAKMGDQARVSATVGTIFPNMSFHAQQPRTILVAHPSGPHHTEMWRWYLVDRTTWRTGTTQPVPAAAPSRAATPTTTRPGWDRHAAIPWYQGPPMAHSRNATPALCTTVGPTTWTRRAGAICAVCEVSSPGARTPTATAPRV